MPELAEKADNESARLGAVRGGASVGSDLDSLPTLVAFASRDEHLNFGLERVAEDDKVTGERAVGVRTADSVRSVAARSSASRPRSRRVHIEGG